MLWFKRKPLQAAQDDAVQRSSIEIIAHKDAKHEVVEDAKAANEQLKKLLVGNGFTLKIYLAAGGKHPQPRGHR